MKRVVPLLGLGLAALVAAPAVAAGLDDQVAPTTAVAPSTTVDTSGGATSTTAFADAVLPVFATCEEAINSPSNTEPCDADEREAFATWGGNVGLLYADDLPIDLGVWEPIGDDDWEFNESVIYACLGVSNGQDEYLWLDEQLLRWTDYSASANEKLFDAAMQYVCPELDYQRQNEWDFHVPAEFAAAPTTTIAAPTTTVAAPTTTIAAPTTSLATPPTTVAGTTTTGETTTLIRTSDGTQPFTCAMLLPAADQPQQPCPEGVQLLFDNIVTGNPSAFDSYIYNEDLGYFSGQDVNVAQTGYVGFWACITMGAGHPYTDYDSDIRALLPAATPADTQLAWDAAARALCPIVSQ